MKAVWVAIYIIVLIFGGMMIYDMVTNELLKAQFDLTSWLLIGSEFMVCCVILLVIIKICKS